MATKTTPTTIIASNDVDYVGMDDWTVQRVAEVNAGTANRGWLMDYDTAESIRHATVNEYDASMEAAKHDGGVGVIVVDGRSCYVID